MDALIFIGIVIIVILWIIGSGLSDISGKIDKLNENVNDRLRDVKEQLEYNHIDASDLCGQSRPSRDSDYVMRF